MQHLSRSTHHAGDGRDFRFFQAMVDLVKVDEWEVPEPAPKRAKVFATAEYI